MSVVIRLTALTVATLGESELRWEFANIRFVFRRSMMKVMT
jgi:hypothetical protein